MNVLDHHCVRYTIWHWELQVNNIIHATFTGRPSTTVPETPAFLLGMTLEEVNELLKEPIREICFESC